MFVDGGYDLNMRITCPALTQWQMQEASLVSCAHGSDAGKQLNYYS